MALENGVNSSVRAATFRIPGRAGTTGQNLASLYNTSNSGIRIRVRGVRVNNTCTVVKAITVLPPSVRVYRVTVAPTNGTAITKALVDSTFTSNAGAVVLQDASADGTSSGTTLTATLPTGAVLDGDFAPRYVTAVGQEIAEAVELLTENEVTLRPGEGIVVALDYTLATQNPTTDMWTVTLRWDELNLVG